VVLQNLRKDGYKGVVIALSGPSQVASMESARALGLHRVLKLPAHVAGSYDLGELETAVDAAVSSQIHTVGPSHPAYLDCRCACGPRFSPGSDGGASVSMASLNFLVHEIGRAGRLSFAHS
jgi:hypothetical protein